MKKEKKNQTKSAAQLQEEAFREKEYHYLVCFIDSCPLRDQCLRWLVGQYSDPSRMVYTTVNPRNPQLGGEHCAMFRKNQRVMMKVGLKDSITRCPPIWNEPSVSISSVSGAVASISIPVVAIVSLPHSVNRKSSMLAAFTVGKVLSSSMVNRKTGIGKVGSL